MTRNKLVRIVKEVLQEYLLEAPQDETPEEEAPAETETPEEEVPEEEPQPIKPEPEPEIDEVPNAESPEIPAGRITIEKAKELIRNTKGKEFAVNFTKKDNTTRVMTATLINPATLVGRPRYNAESKNLMPVLDTVANSIRVINLGKLKSLTIGNKTYTLSPSTAVTEIKRMQKLAGIKEAEERSEYVKSIQHYKDLFKIDKGKISKKMTPIIQGVIDDVEKNGGYATKKEIGILSGLKTGLYTSKK